MKITYKKFQLLLLLRSVFPDKVGFRFSVKTAFCGFGWLVVLQKMVARRAEKGQSRARKIRLSTSWVGFSLKLWFFIDKTDVWIPTDLFFLSWGSKYIDLVLLVSLRRAVVCLLFFFCLIPPYYLDQDSLLDLNPMVLHVQRLLLYAIREKTVD